MSRLRLVDANKAIGRCNMNHDKELAEYEAAERHAHSGGIHTFPLPSQDKYILTVASPVAIDKETDLLLEQALTTVR